MNEILVTRIKENIMTKATTAACLASCIGLLGMAGAAQGATLSTGSYFPAAPGQFTLTIWITGGGAVKFSNYLLIIGDGGPDIGGTINPQTAPRIISGHSDTGVFAGNNTGNQFTYIFPGNTLMAWNGAVTEAGTVSGDGVLATFLIDTTNAIPGVYPIRLYGPDTHVNGHPVDLEGGVISMLLDPPVFPEPASALLLIGALPFLRRRSA